MKGTMASALPWDVKILPCLPYPGWLVYPTLLLSTLLCPALPCTKAIPAAAERTAPPLTAAPSQRFRPGAGLGAQINEPNAAGYRKCRTRAPPRLDDGSIKYKEAIVSPNDTT